MWRCRIRCVIILDMNVKLIDFQLAQAEIQRELAKLRGNKYATVGIHEDAGEHPDSGMTNAQLGAKLNFGDETNTLFGHPAPIPPRPWLIPGVESATPDVIDTIASGIEKGLPTDQIMEQVGEFAAGAVQQYMTDLRTPPNSAYTIAQKGSSNPLIDTGALRASVTYKVSNEKPDEGIL